MARLFIDGFELGTPDLWVEGSGGGSLTSAATAVISGSYSYSLSSYSHIRKQLSSYTEAYVGITIQPKDLDRGQILSFRKNATRLMGGVQLNAGGQLNITLGTVILATSIDALSTGNNYRMEVFYKVATVDGLIEVKINNSTVVSYAGNTQPTTFTAFDLLNIGGNDINTLKTAMVVDDVVIDTTVWPGNGRVAGLAPAAAGDSTGWTPSVSSNWECVDEIPGSTTDYVHTNSTGALDLYGISALTTNATNINCVQVSAYAEKEGVPAFSDIYLAMSLNSTVALSEALTPGEAGSPLCLSKLWELNPMTGSSFTLAEFSSIQIGIQGATT